MGRPPAYIFVVRHGKRLDAADKQWHLTSPTPYDPPLTYGGWMQSKSVGARIAAILRDQEAEDEAAAPAGDATARPRKKRRYRVVLHSSPFLRCVQSSVAISAGLGANPSTAAVSAEGPAHQARPLWNTTQGPPSPSPAPVRARPSIIPPAGAEHIDKSVLRLDPFLGEWLSPDYFEQITPPPKSALMLATAKAELLRRENYNDYPNFHGPPRTSAANSNSGHLWSASPKVGSPLISSMTAESTAPSGLDSLSSLGSSLPGQGNTSHQAAPHGHIPPRGYVSPVPTYALSPSEPIPRGYVAHARDACVDVDYQWDSTREQLAWGDGGVLPEEWASMHQRFRRGLRRLVDWYTNTEHPGEMVTKTPRSASSSRSPPGAAAGHEGEDDDDVEIQDVVVLVSHGAGCNALIGAITQQPVLADVAMSSLTMAKRRPQFDSPVDALPVEKTATSLDEVLPRSVSSMPEMYELKLFANTEHLQSAVTTPSRSRSSSVAGGASHSRSGSGQSSVLREIALGAMTRNDIMAGSRSNSANASLGSMRRASGGPTTMMRSAAYNSSHIGGITVGSGVSHFPAAPTRTGSFGLWSPKREDEPEQEPEHPMMLDFSHEKEISRKELGAEGKDEKDKKSGESVSAGALPSPIVEEQQERGPSQHEEDDQFDEDAAPRLWAGTGNGGLWGAPRPPGEAERLRDFSSTKRRWTVNERSEAT
ncbi:hypothetical protein GGR56DRAFT_320595 [Xylariaceae sp. FL0804]|nr:hypothetical protein GGR56DRAFT_320595 [Xylariaceae sp. FL0804]